MAKMPKVRIACIAPNGASFEQIVYLNTVKETIEILEQKGCTNFVITPLKKNNVEVNSRS